MGLWDSVTLSGIIAVSSLVLGARFGLKTQLAYVTFMAFYIAVRW